MIMRVRRPYSKLSKVSPLVHTLRVVIIGCGWAISFVGRGRYERAPTGQWIARIGADLGPRTSGFGSGLDEQAVAHVDAEANWPYFRGEGLSALSEARTERTDSDTPGVGDWT